MKRIRDLFPGSSPPPARIAAYLALLIVMTGLVKPDLFRLRADRLSDGHAISSLDLAITRAMCGSASKISPFFTAANEVRDHPELMRVPIKQIIAGKQGSVEQFCARVQDDFVNTENALLWTESWLIRLSPDASVDSIGAALHRIRVTMLVLVSALLLFDGFGLIVTAASWWWALILLQQMREDVTSTFPFLFVLPLFTAVVFATIGARGWLKSLAGLSVFSVAAGAWSSFGVNMRSSHLPIYLALFAAGVVIGLRDRLQWRPLALAAAVFAVAYFGFQYLAITRYVPESQALTGHAVLHPIVLALAVPESDLSRREGLAWDDSVGDAIGRRIDPTAKYGSPEYESALRRYYVGLWREHPGEMIGVYLRKAQVAGKSMLGVVRWQGGRAGRVINLVLAPLDLLPNGLFLLAGYAALALSSLVLSWQRGGAGVAVLALLSIVALLMQLESSLIMSEWVAKYHSYLAFFCVVISVAAPAYVVSRFLPPATKAA